MAKQKSAQIIFTDNAEIVNDENNRPRTRRQFNGHVPEKERTDKPSQTVPDSSMTITEMLQRTKRGLPISSGRQPIWNGEKLLPDWKKLDLIDRQRVVENAKRDVEHKKVIHQKQKKKVDELLAEADRKKAAEAAEKVAVENTADKKSTTGA